MDTPTLPTARPRLISKEDHLAGEKSLALVTRWGEPVTVRLVSLTHRQIHRIGEKLAKDDCFAQEFAFAITAASLAPEHEPKLIEHLNMSSISKLQAHALAFAFGENLPAQPAPAGLAANPS